MFDQKSFKESKQYFFRERSPGQPWQMISLELVPGNRCQLSCRNCYKRGQSNIKSVTENLGDMPVGFAEDILAQAHECGFSEVAFIGGEPTLHPQLLHLVNGALAFGFTPVVCTNGILMADPVYAEEIAQPGVTVMIHAPLPEPAAGLHDAHAGMAGYNNLLYKASANLSARSGVTVVAEIAVIRPFLPYIPQVLSWCHSQGVRPFIEMNRRYDNRGSFPDAASPEETKELFELLATYDLLSPNHLVPPLYSQPCTMSITGVHIKNNGSGDCGGVYSCCAQGICHGDLRKESLASLLMRPSFEVFRKQDDWIAGPCRHCEDYGLCRGGCRGEAFLAFGCARASCPVCWKIPSEIRLDRSVMCPPDCAGCPLEGTCPPHRLEYS